MGKMPSGLPRSRPGNQPGFFEPADVVIALFVFALACPAVVMAGIENSWPWWVTGLGVIGAIGSATAVYLAIHRRISGNYP